MLRRSHVRRVKDDIGVAAGEAVSNRAALVGLYRESFKLATAQRDPQLRAQAVADVRQQWRERKGAMPETAGIFIAQCIDRIEYARLCLSKSAIRAAKVPSASTSYAWDVQKQEQGRAFKQTKRENKDGNVSSHETHGKGLGRDFVPMGSWGRGCMDPDVIRQHRELTDRQYFMGPHWRGKAKPLVYSDLSMEQQALARAQAPVETVDKAPKKF
jgi:hypothetical protein